VTDPVNLIRRFALALCVWREARGETLLGKMLVAQTIENRVTDSRWPDTYIGVITQPWQFSAFNRNDPNVTAYPTETDRTWLDCVAAADLVLAAPSPLTPANHYHAKDIDPSWKRDDRVVAREGAHVFYRL
jgi:N-acetylmuramoyl-L-alanine amidase